ncbi:MAG: HIT domain-containing protein [Candidatus Micrarchaeota archaeon]|nr:HIT domain-containing protein [Candidatus Micrarchaeota archaeon]
MQKDCLFCNIASGKVPSYRIYEDKEHMAFLDIFPNIKGQTLVIPKKHYDSYAFDIDDDELKEFMIAAKRVSKLIEKKLNVGRVHMVLEGTGVNHLHAKLYPAISTEKAFKEHIAKENVYFDAYPGYVTTLMGPKAKDDELKALQELLTD